MLAKDLEKNAMYLINNFGVNLKAKLLESPKQGKGYKEAVLMMVYGEEAGFYDEAGSVYVNDIISKVYITGSVSGGYNCKTQNKKGDWINV